MTALLDEIIRCSIRAHIERSVNTYFCEFCAVCAGMRIEFASSAKGPSVLMKTDGELEQDVLSELRWTPGIDTTDIALKVHAGVVTLTGFANAYRDKLAVETAAKRTPGVRGIANEIQVRDSMDSAPSDPEIAREAVATLARMLPGLREHLKVIVHQGHLTLEGSAPLYFQREQAESILKGLDGVKSITNDISVGPSVNAIENGNTPASA